MLSTCEYVISCSPPCITLACANLIVLFGTTSSLNARLHTKIYWNEWQRMYHSSNVHICACSTRSLRTQVLYASLFHKLGNIVISHGISACTCALHVVRIAARRSVNVHLTLTEENYEIQMEFKHASATRINRRKLNIRRFRNGGNSGTKQGFVTHLNIWNDLSRIPQCHCSY